MHQAVQDHVQQCDVCQRLKAETAAPAGLLQPLPFSSQVWDDIILDFIERLPLAMILF